MVDIRTFSPGDLWKIKLQPTQAKAIGFLTEDYALALAAAGPAITATVDGEPVACCGIARAQFNTGVLWGFVGESAGRNMLRLHRAASRFIGALPMTRIESTVEQGFAPGCRWLELLGFESEGLMRKYGPDGSNHLRYARVS